VRCSHPDHPFPRKLYALKLLINYASETRSASLEQLYGGECLVLRRLPRHPNLCSLIAEFTSDVPDEMFEHLTPVTIRACIRASSLTRRVTPAVMPRARRHCRNCS
jgi:hypothetical protein